MAPTPPPPDRYDAARALTGRNLRVARWSVIVAGSLALAKLVTVVVTGSLAVAASLADSAMDIVASSLNLFAVRFAGQPADEDHRYGHGKAEGLAGLAQGLLIGFAGVYLLVEGVSRLVRGTFELQHTGVGIAVMAVSLVASIWIGWLLERTGRATGSVALQADAAHYTTDVWTNLGVLGSLAVVALTGWQAIDGIVACGVALVVLYASFSVMRRSMGELMDVSLDPDAVARIREAIRERVPAVRGVHDLRTRKAGPNVFVDLHVSIDRDLSFPRAHRLSEDVRMAILAEVPEAQVHVHADPHPLLPGDEPPAPRDAP